MIKNKYPITKMTADIEVLGGEITLTELTLGYRDLINDDPSLDTPRNALLCCGLTKEQVDLLGEQVAGNLYKDIIDMTYPDARTAVEAMMDDGTYVEPTADETTIAKKN